MTSAMTFFEIESEMKVLEEDMKAPVVGEFVALKSIRFTQADDEGIPSTALREIQYLRIELAEERGR